MAASTLSAIGLPPGAEVRVNGQDATLKPTADRGVLRIAPIDDHGGPDFAPLPDEGGADTVRLEVASPDGAERLVLQIPKAELDKVGGALDLRAVAPATAPLDRPAYRPDAVDYWSWRADSPMPRRRAPSTLRPLSAIPVDTRQPRRHAIAIAAQQRMWLPAFLSRVARASARDPLTGGEDPSSDEISNAYGVLAQTYRDRLLAAETAPDTWLSAVSETARQAPGLQDAELLGEQAAAGLDALRAAGLLAPLPSPAAVQADAEASWRDRGLLGPNAPPWSGSDAALIDRLTNGINPTPPTRAGDLWSWRFGWTDGDGRRLPQEGPRAHTLPDVTVEATHDPAGGPPSLSGIEATWWRPDGSAVTRRWAPDRHPGSDTPEAATPWAWAKRLARQALLLAGQLDWHLGRCHVAVEVWWVALRRTVRFDHPLCQSLWPFLRSADEINALGDPLLLDDTGLFGKATALSAAAASQRIRAAVLQSHHRDPTVRRGPLWDGDHFGAWSQAAWTAAGAWLDGALRRGKLDAPDLDPAERGHALVDALQAELRAAWSEAPEAVEFARLETLADVPFRARHIKGRINI